jgi:hypothetical protein
VGNVGERVVELTSIVTGPKTGPTVEPSMALLVPVPPYTKFWTWALVTSAGSSVSLNSTRMMPNFTSPGFAGAVDAIAVDVLPAVTSSSPATWTTPPRRTPWMSTI